MPKLKEKFPLRGTGEEIAEGYEIFPNGKVVSYKGVNPRWVTLKRDAGGHLICSIQKEGKSKTIYLYKYVAEFYVRNPHCYEYLKFKDGDIRNVDASNLRWVAGGKYTKAKVWQCLK